MPAGQQLLQLVSKSIFISVYPQPSLPPVMYIVVPDFSFLRVTRQTESELFPAPPFTPANALEESYSLGHSLYYISSLSLSILLFVQFLAS